MMRRLHLNPLNVKRLRRFWSVRRARWSLVALALLYVLSLAAELVCNSRPLLLRLGGRTCFPAFRFYSEDELLHNGRFTRPDYLAMARDGRLDHAWCLWTPLRADPYRIVPVAELQPSLRELVRLTPLPRVAGLLLDEALVIRQASGLESLLPAGAPVPDLQGCPLGQFWELPAGLSGELSPRFQGRSDHGRTFLLKPLAGGGLPPVELDLSPVREAASSRALVRGRLLEPRSGQPAGLRLERPCQWSFRAGSALPTRRRALFQALPEELRSEVATGRTAARQGQEVPSRRVVVDGRQCLLTVELERARYPFRPVEGHPLGLDSAGRDVLARIVYALRLALNFGLILVALALSGGSLAGILQGYLGGKVDLLGQRLTELWSAIPFLYVMILMGSLYGTGFGLLIVCYGLFNWIGVSHYMRAETLRLRRMPFVEAARCLGLRGWSIAWRHILPNAMVPLITLFPFSLVGAISSLAALDYLGFGVPPPAPSLGELLAQAQVQPWAWWLILFPALTLFGVMLAGVFIGEGVRNAFDPRRQTRF